MSPNETVTVVDDGIKIKIIITYAKADIKEPAEYKHGSATVRIIPLENRK